MMALCDQVFRQLFSLDFPHFFQVYCRLGNRNEYRLCDFFFVLNVGNCFHYVRKPCQKLQCDVPFHRELFAKLPKIFVVLPCKHGVQLDVHIVFGDVFHHDGNVHLASSDALLYGILYLVLRKAVAAGHFDGNVGISVVHGFDFHGDIALSVGIFASSEACHALDHTNLPRFFSYFCMIPNIIVLKILLRCNSGFTPYL